jgi:hypothetical protein
MYNEDKEQYLGPNPLSWVWGDGLLSQLPRLGLGSQSRHDVHFPLSMTVMVQQPHMGTCTMGNIDLHVRCRSLYPFGKEIGAVPVDVRRMDTTNMKEVSACYHLG